MSSASENAPRRKTSVRGIGTVLSLLILAFGVYYFVHVQRKTAYFAARNLRILATVAEQIRDRIRTPEGQSTGALVWDVASERFDGRTVDDVVRGVFSQSFVNVFDSVLVVDHTGVVKWQRPAGVCSATSLDELTEVRGFGEEVKLKATDLQRRAQDARVIIEGREFRLFTQPMAVAVGDTGPRQWVVAGLISRERFASESVTISYTILIVVFAAFLLILFSLPFLKLALLGERQRVRLGDILLLGISLLCATAIVTIILFDVIAYRRTRAYSDAQLRHLASDIKRQVRTEIARAYDVLTALERRLPPPAGHPDLLLPSKPDDVSPPLPEALRREEAAVRDYPFFESFSRIAINGVQSQKWVLDSRPLQRVGVSERTYFVDALRSQGWAVNGGRDHYVLEAIRSRTSGATQAVIAKRAVTGTRSDYNAVVALAFPMLSLIDAVVAGDCRFAVIDGDGNVLFHSEPRRNNVENFFVETDQSKALRSAVAGRQNEMLNVRYWGEDQRAFTTPINGTPWTLVTFRSKHLLRTLNVETIMITVMFLLIYALAYVAFGGLFVAAFPSYRAPWLWPDRERGDDYTRLTIAYVLLSLSFVAGIYLFRPRVVLVLAGTLPAITLLVTYLRLARERTAMAFVAGGGAIALAAVTFAYAIAGAPETDVLLPVGLVRLFILVTCTAGVLYAVPWREQKAASGEAGAKPLMPTYRYITGAALLLALSAVLPTAALYKAAYKIEIESFIKHGQLELVRDIEERLRRLEWQRTEGWRDEAVHRARVATNLGIYGQFFFRSEMYLLPPADVLEKRIKRALKAGEDRLEALTRGAVRLDPERNPVPRLVEWLLPQYSEHSIRMREMLHSESADKRWIWRRDGNALVFSNASIYGVDMVVRSSVPRLVPRPSWLGETAPSPLPLTRLFDGDRSDYSDVAWPGSLAMRVGRYTLIGVALFAYVALLLLAVRFISRKVFLVDVRDPLWLDPNARLSPALVGNLLIFAKTSELGLKLVDRRRCVEVKLGALGPEGGGWVEALNVVDEQPPEKGVLIPDFERCLDDAARRSTALRLIESLLDVHGRRVFAVTTVSPWVLLDRVTLNAAEAERWRAAIQRFNVRIETVPESAAEPAEPKRATDFVLPPAVGVAGLVRLLPEQFDGSRTYARAVIARETAGRGAFLESLGTELRKETMPGGEEEIYDEILERATGHYEALWNGCTAEEKLVLAHLAADGFANEKDRHVLRRLLARELVVRTPNPRVMNETFRRYILSDACTGEISRLDPQVPPSAWDKIQQPLIVGLVVGGGFFFFTQRELFDATFAIVTGVAGGIPAVMKVAGLFLEPRSALAAGGR